MANQGRSYSDPSYGSKKVFTFERVSMGTRTDETCAAAGAFHVLHPIKVTKFTVMNSVTGDGGTAAWVLHKNATSLGTLIFVTNPTTGTSMSTAPGTDGLATSGDVLHLLSASSVADPAQFLRAEVEYIERYLDTDN
jgi:hypothetical protein